MTNKTNNNRRQYYRYEPPANAAPLLSLVLGGHSCPAQQVIDVSLKGIRLVFSDSELPPLTAGAPITASIKAAGLRDAADIAFLIVVKVCVAARHRVTISCRRWC